MGGLTEPDEDDSPEEIVKRVKDCRSQARSSQAEWRDETRTSYDLVAGRQWDAADEAVLTSEGRPVVTFNFTGTTIDAVSGSEINNRQEVAFIPREIGDVAKDEIMTAAAQCARDNCDAEDEESDSFWDVLVCGVGWTETRMDYERDDEGELIIERVDPLEMRWDPSARKRNLADAKWVQRERGFTKDEITARWPDAELPESAELDTEEDGTLEADSKPDGYRDAHEAQPSKRKLYQVIQHQWYELECIYKVLSPDTGEIIKVPEDRYKVLEAMAMQSGQQLQSAKMHKRKYFQSFICGDTLLEFGEAPCQDDFTFQAITGKRDRNKGVWFGLVRPMQDPQKWANKFFAQLLHIINTNAKGGLMMESGATDNMRKFEKDWAKTNAVARLNPGGLAKVQPKPMPAIPPIIGDLMHFSIDSIRGASGVNLELLGLADRQQAGVLENQRTQAGLTILAPFFGSLRLYRKRSGRVILYYITNYMSDGRLIRIAGEGSEQYVPLVREPGVIKYDIIVDDAPTARDMKERTWAALMQILPMLKAEGIPIPPEVVEYAPLPSKLIAAWKPMLQQAQQPKPEQQMMMKLDMDQRAAEIEKTQAAADQAQSAAQLNYVKAQIESLQPLLQGLQQVLAAFVPKPGPGGGEVQQMPPQMPMQPMPQGPMGPLQAGPTPFQ